MELTDLAALGRGPSRTALRAELSALVRPAPLVLWGEARAATDLVTMASWPAIRRALRELPTVTVLVTAPDSAPQPLVEAVDVCVTDQADPPRPWVEGDLEGLVSAVSAQPQAALALATLLRVSRSLSVWDAVQAESAAYALLLGSAPYREWLLARGPAAVRQAVGEPILLRRVDGVLHATLNRPEVRNAVDATLRDALVDALELAESDDSIERVQLSGAGLCFSAGGDLAEFGTVPDPATAYAVRMTRHPGLAVARVANRTTAHLHGACVGAGIEIPAFAARVTASADTTVRLPELSMGLIPGAGGTVSITRRIGRHRCAWLALSGAVLGSDLAQRWGLIDQILPAD